MDQFKPKFEQLEIEKLRKVQTMDKRNFEFAQKAFPAFVAAYKVRSFKILLKSQFCSLTTKLSGIEFSQLCNLFFLQNHDCKYIFREKDLLSEIGQYATMFGLLKMPKMPEIQNLKIIDFEESSIDIDTLTYKDKALRNGIQ